MQMGIEQSGSRGKGTTMSTVSKKSKRRQKRSIPVQKLYDTCKEVFADCGPHIVPSTDKLEKLSAVLDGMTQADVGLKPNMPFFSSDQAPIITYMHIADCDKFSIGIFYLPPNSVIPLHNHPGMTVFSKILFGTMHIKAYDWLHEEDYMSDSNSINPKGISFVNTRPYSSMDFILFIDAGHSDGPRLAKLKVNTEFTAPCAPSILYPAEGGNMHCFTAKTPCAVLDVLGPPYCDPDGRHCQYYDELPFSKISGTNEEKEGYVWLKEREKPEDLSVVGVPYNGPRIRIHTK